MRCGRAKFHLGLRPQNQGRDARSAIASSTAAPVRCAPGQRTKPAVTHGDPSKRCIPSACMCSRFFPRVFRVWEHVSRRARKISCICPSLTPRMKPSFPPCRVAACAREKRAFPCLDAFGDQVGELSAPAGCKRSLTANNTRLGSQRFSGSFFFFIVISWRY